MMNLNELVNNGKIPSLYSFFQKIPDFREQNSKLIYPLADILLLMVLATASGKNSQRSIEEYGLNNSEYLVTPSKSIINHICTKLPVKDLTTAFQEWLNKVIECIPDNNNLESDSIDLSKITASIDGKSMNGFKGNTRLKDSNPLYAISLYIHQIGIVLNWVGIEGVKNVEIKTFREFIQNDFVKIFTGDALHCNQETLRKIVTHKKSYVIACKRKVLLKHAIYESELHSTVEVIDDNKKTTREYTFRNIKNDFLVKKRTYRKRINKHGNEVKQSRGLTKTWGGCEINTLIQVKTTTKTKKNQFVISNYNYISSLRLDDQSTPEELIKIIRGHWSIENGLHWNKDIVFKEDKHKTSNANSTFLFTELFNIVISIFHLNGYSSMQKTIDRLTNRIVESMKVLGIPIESVKSMVD
jgi:predicted transposase YbfD/YdcC